MPSSTSMVSSLVTFSVASLAVPSVSLLVAEDLDCLVGVGELCLNKSLILSRSDLRTVMALWIVERLNSDES